MPKEQDFAAVFARLKSMLEPYAPQLLVTEDGPGGYNLDTTHLLPNGSRLFFAGVRINKRYVSFYLMPVYVRPDLLAGLSPALRKRMQGKSCFNFAAVDETLFAELSDLTVTGFAAYRQAGYLAG